MKSTLIALMILIAGMGVAWAEDVMLNVTPEEIVTALDKNGNAYTRMIIPESKTMQGVEYSDSIPLMFFGELADEASAHPEGTPIRVIAKKRTYQGRDSYTALKIIK